MLVQLGARTEDLGLSPFYRIITHTLHWMTSMAYSRRRHLPQFEV